MALAPGAIPSNLRGGAAARAAGKDEPRPADEETDRMSLEMKGDCERCRARLAHEGVAYICSHECTFCAACARELRGVCPNCGGELVRRPTRNEAPASCAVGT